MSASSCSAFPVKNQAFRTHAVIRSLATGNPLTGGLTGIAAQVSIDGAAFTSTGVTATEIGTTGYLTVDIDATRMNGNGILLRVDASNTNHIEFTAEIRPVMLSDIANHWMTHTVIRLEQCLMLLSGGMSNTHPLSQIAETIYGRDDTTVIATGTVSGLQSPGGTVTRNKMT